MKKLLELSTRNMKKIIGLMSGTSVDGVDVALVEVEGNWIDTKINLIGYIEYKYPEGLREFVLKNSVKETSNVRDISQLNFLLPRIYVDAVNSLLKQLDISITEIDLIGSHGQTIHHIPEEEDLFGINTASTLQIGSPSVIAKLTGVVTVGNFRAGDMALGGQGAPLVPYFDFLLFHSAQVNRALLNIGGIANITILNKNGSQSDVLAFDTGPGNMMIDYLMKRIYGKSFDEEGVTAESGSLNEELFNALVLKDKFIERTPPKSTGREYYGEEFLEEFLNRFNEIPGEDWLHTVTKFTAYGVYRNYELFVKKETGIEELFVSGGGAKNLFLYRCLNEYFGAAVQLKIIDEIGISSDAKEAICFAVLANELIHGNEANIPRTTGATKPTLLGEICLP